MSEVAEQVAAASPVAEKKVKKVSAVKKPKTKPNHPPTSEMVDAAIAALKERGGSSVLAIKKYVAATYKVDVEKLAPFIKKYIKGAVVKGHLLQTKGKGASGSFKLSTKAPAKKSATKPKSDKPKKTAAAKPKVAKKPAGEKKTVAKKAATKKPAAAKKAVKPKATAAKKTVKAKPAASKPKAAAKPKKAASSPKKAAPKAKKPVAKKVSAKK